MFGSLGFWEIMLILGLALLLFGPKRLPEIGRSLGKGIREFKKGTSGLMDSLNADIKEPIQSTPQPNQAHKTREIKPEPRPEPAQATVIDFEKKDEHTP